MRACLWPAHGLRSRDVLDRYYPLDSRCIGQIEKLVPNLKHARQIHLSAPLLRAAAFLAV